MLAQFGEHALRTDDLDWLLHEATEMVSKALDVELVKVLQFLPQENTMLIRAGVNWKPGVVGHAKLGAHSQSPGGYALQTNEPVVSPNISAETRFEIPQLLLDHGVRSMVNVVIRGEEEAFGVLEVDSRQSREFGEDDVAFLKNYANLMAAAIGRLTMQEKLREVASDRQVLARELNHRIKNLLVGIQALCHQTLKTARSKEEFTELLIGRINAQIRSQDVLDYGTGGARETPTLDELIRLELAARGAQEGRQFFLDGPEVRLPARCAQAMIMTVHELATNAVKYGAFSTDGGGLDVSWTTEERDGGPHLLFRWRERGVAVASPGPKGFGTRMIERQVPHMVQGTARLAFHPDGVECVIECPLSDPE